MFKKVLVEGPVLTKSGYGEHSRLVLRALRKRKDLEIYINPLEWGKTSWLWEDTEERQWIDEVIMKTMDHASSGSIPLDIQVHVGIPLEFEKKAPYSICVTAGIETTKISKSWLLKCKEIDKIIVPSEHAKWGFENSSYMEANPETGEQINIKCDTPIEVIPYPVKDTIPDTQFNLKLHNDFNFLMVAQWSSRKNIPLTIEWFLEEFKDEDVGLVVKTSFARSNTMDLTHTSNFFEKIAKKFGDKKCKLYLLHGDMSEEEMMALYHHKKIKAIVSATHGEGFGLPLFEAAYSGLPVVAPSWSGHVDFLYVPAKNNRMKPMFADVDYDIMPVQKEAVWENIIESDSMWCFPRKTSFQEKIRNVYKNYGMYKSRAKKLKSHVREKFSSEKILSRMSNEIAEVVELPECEYIFISDAFIHQFSGGAELSIQTLVNTAPGATIGFNTNRLNKKIIDHYSDKKWIFGNIAALDPALIAYIPKSGIKYSFIEFDYKYCMYRNPALFSMMEGNTCEYITTELAQLIQTFALAAESVFFMSDKQRSLYFEHLPAMSMSNSHVLSSLFERYTFEHINFYNLEYQNKKDDKWLVLGSKSWVKGQAESEAWCKENNLDYEVISDLSYVDFLKKMAQSKGLCFLPIGLDTCPRMVIEAKLLGCELKINENVQHAQEDWFTRPDDEIIKYLNSRPSEFWSKAFGC